MKLGAILLGFSFLLSKILGLLRDNLLAASFGASAGAGIFNLDTYYAAFRLPDLLFNLFSYGVLSAAFVPIFVEILKREGRGSAFRFSNEILHTLCLVVIAISAVLFIFTPQLVSLFVPGFDAENIKITVTVTRIMLVTPILFTAGSIAGGIQNAFSKFWGLALAPVFYNAGIILGIVFLSADHGVYGVAIGVSFGALLNVLVQLPAILRAGYKYMIPFRLWSSRVKEMIGLSLPRIFGMSVAQLSLIVDTIIASTLAAGSITVINFASNLEHIPIGIIGISIAIVSFGTLSGFAAESKIADFVALVSDNIRRILFLMIPLTLGMFTLRFQIVRLVLGRGKFSWTDTILTANTLGVFLAGLMFGGLVFLLARAFYALKDTKTPVIIGIIAVAINIGLSLIFTRVIELNTYGLALANVTANIINALLLLLLLSKKLRAPLLDSREIFKFIFAAFIMTLAVQIIKVIFGEIFPDIDTYVELIAQTGVAALAGVFVYFGICWLMGCKDAQLKKLR